MFHSRILEVDEANDKVQLTTFKAGLKSRGFMVSLAKISPRTTVDMLLKVQKYVNVNNALIAIQEVEKPKERERKEDDWR